MNKLATFFVIMLFFTLLTPLIANVNCERWSLVARFTGSGNKSYTTDSFTCNHADWRIRWETVPGGHIHFTRYSFLQVTTYPDGEFNDYIDFIDVGGIVHAHTGVHHIYNCAGKFYMQIYSSTFTKNYNNR